MVAGHRKVLPRAAGLMEGKRRGGGAVERTGLENRRARKGTVGSNPTLSAMKSNRVSHSCTRRSLLNDLRWDNARKGVPEGEAPQGAESSHLSAIVTLPPPDTAKFQLVPPRRTLSAP